MSLRGGEGITHLHYSGTPLWPFSHGASYTRFTVALVSKSAQLLQQAVEEAEAEHSLTVSTEELMLSSAEDWASTPTYTAGAAARRSFTVAVSNKGAVASGVTIPAFITPLNESAAGRFPRQKLFGFTGIDLLQPGETRTGASLLARERGLCQLDLGPVEQFCLASCTYW